MIGQLPAPITGPSAWSRADFASEDSFIEQLHPSEILEISDAADRFLDSGLPLENISTSNFRLGAYSAKLDHMRHDVLSGKGFSVLRGLPVDDWSREKSVTVFFGLGRYLGNARSQNAKGHLLGHVRDLGLATSDPKVRIYQTTERQTFHTDSCDIVALLCLKNARSGGDSALVSSMRIYNEMYHTCPDLLAELFHAFPTDRRGEIPDGKKSYFEIPVYNWHQNYLSVIYARTYITSAQRLSGVRPTTEREVEALNMFDALANDERFNIFMRLQPGDMQFVHNHTILHDRTAFTDWDEPAKKRHLLRLWLAAPDARPLPEVYAERYGSVEIGNRGGIVVPGTRLHVPLEAA